MRSPSPLDPRTVLGAVKARPGIARARRDITATPALTAPPRGAVDDARGGTKEQPRHEQRNYTR